MSYWDRYDDRNREAHRRGERDAEYGHSNHEYDYDLGSERREAYENGYREVRREQERREEIRQEEDAAERRAEARRIEARRFEEMQYEQEQYQEQCEEPIPEQPIEDSDVC